MISARETYKIYFEAESECVIMEWDGYSSSADFREGTELMLNTLIRHNASKVIASIKGMTLIGLEDQQWLNTTFLPRAIKFGLKQVAITKPDSYFTKVAVESISYKTDKSKLSINFFDNLTEAKKWLCDVEAYYQDGE
jgi:hypothetical protein